MIKPFLKFEVGKRYYSTSLEQGRLPTIYEVVRRDTKVVWLKSQNSEASFYPVQRFEGYEVIKLGGSLSSPHLRPDQKHES